MPCDAYNPISLIYTPQKTMFFLVGDWQIKGAESQKAQRAQRFAGALPSEGLAEQNLGISSHHGFDFNGLMGFWVMIQVILVLKSLFNDDIP